MTTNTPAVIETFYWNEERNGRMLPAVVKLAKIPDHVKVSTGQLYPLESPTTVKPMIVLLSERRVRNPEEGFRYFEYKARS